MGLSVQVKKFKIDFQDSGHNGTASLDFRSERFYLFLIYKSPQCCLPSFKTIGISVQEKKFKIYYQDGGHGGHLEFPFRTILTIFHLHVAPKLPKKFKVSWPFGSGEAKIRFSRWRPFWISCRNDFSYFRSTSLPDVSYQVSSKLAYSFRRRSEK